MKILFIAIATIFFSCAGNYRNYHNNGGLQLGKPLPTSAVRIDTISGILDEPNQFKSGIKINYKGIIYYVCLNKFKKLIYILTYDPSFSSPDGYKIGDSFSKLIKSSIIKKTVISGYEVDVLLPSGWNARFADQAVVQNDDVSDTSKIKSFYKKLNNLSSC